MQKEYNFETRENNLFPHHSNPNNPGILPCNSLQKIYPTRIALPIVPAAYQNITPNFWEDHRRNPKDFAFNKSKSSYLQCSYNPCFPPKSAPPAPLMPYNNNNIMNNINCTNGTNINTNNNNNLNTNSIQNGRPKSARSNANASTSTTNTSNTSRSRSKLNNGKPKGIINASPSSSSSNPFNPSTPSNNNNNNNNNHRITNSSPSSSSSTSSTQSHSNRNNNNQRITNPFKSSPNNMLIASCSNKKQKDQQSTKYSQIRQKQASNPHLTHRVTYTIKNSQNHITSNMHIQRQQHLVNTNNNHNKNINHETNQNTQNKNGENNVDHLMIILPAKRKRGRPRKYHVDDKKRSDPLMTPSPKKRKLSKRSADRKNLEFLQYFRGDGTGPEMQIDDLSPDNNGNNNGKDKGQNAKGFQRGGIRKNNNKNCGGYNNVIRIIGGRDKSYKKPPPDHVAYGRIRIWKDNVGRQFYDCICNARKPVQDLNKIKSHVLGHDKIVWVCDICGREFFNNHLQLNAHMKTHKKREIKANEQPIIG